MRRVRLVVALLLVVAACSGDDDDTSSPTSSPATSEATTSTTEESTTTTTSPVVESIALTDECTGIGALADTDEVTFIQDGRIVTDDGRCIAEYTGPSRLSWGGNADRLLAGDRSVLLADGPSDVVEGELEAVGWSRPTGKAIVVRNDEDELSKRSLIGEPPLALSGLPLGLRDVEYHPSGTAIAGIEDLGPNVILASNRGEDPRWLLANEPADAITDIAFSADGDLLFVAQHDDQWHLHRLVLGELDVSTEVVADEPIGDISASPLYEGATAAARGTCEEPGALFVEVDGEVRDFTGTDVEHGRPVGWTGGTGLVVLVPDECGEDGPASGDLYVITTLEAELVAEDVGAAAVRLVLPPPPPPPPDIAEAPA